MRRRRGGRGRADRRGRAGAARSGAREEIDARGLHVLPGAVDAHVHFNEPGRTDWEGWATGTRGAGGRRRDGRSSRCRSTPTRRPSTARRSTPSSPRARRAAHVDFALWGGLVPGNLDAPRRARRARRRRLQGVHVGQRRSRTSSAPTTSRSTRACARRASSASRSRSTPRARRSPRPAARALAAGRTGVRDYLASRPAVAELEAIATALIASPRRPAARCTSSTSRPAAASRWSPRRGPAASTRAARPARTTSSSTRTTPSGSARSPSARRPLRPAAESDALWAALADGSLPMVASDHSPSPPRAEATATRSTPGAGSRAARRCSPLVLGDGRLAPAVRGRAAGAASPPAASRLDGKGRLEPGVRRRHRARRPAPRRTAGARRRCSTATATARSSGARCAPGSSERSCAAAPCGPTGRSRASRRGRLVVPAAIGSGDGAPRRHRAAGGVQRRPRRRRHHARGLHPHLRAPRSTTSPG